MDKSFISIIKERLTRPLPGTSAQLKMSPTFRPVTNNDVSATKAGVLLLLYPNPAELFLVFMKRPTYPGVHSAQVSFPGGKLDTTDQDMTDTALRETFEEIGIVREKIEILGTLTPLYIPVSEMKVFPMVGFCAEKPAFKIDPNEVAYLIEEPLQSFFKAEVKKIKPFTSEKYTGKIPYFDIQENHIWGATAMILNEFLEIVNEV